jgi:hypothetical protein
MQAVVSASLQEDEYIKEFLITHDKVSEMKAVGPLFSPSYMYYVGQSNPFYFQIPILIQNLITTEVWKSKVFPKLLANDEDTTVMFPLYIVVNFFHYLFLSMVLLIIK